MIDDLVTNGTTEPYRMFTSRSEYRISIRADNADLRLTQKGIDLGLISKERAEKFNKKYNDLCKARVLSENLTLTTSNLAKQGVNISQTGEYKSAFSLMGLPNVHKDKIVELFSELKTFGNDILEILSIESKYSSYLIRQKSDINLFKLEEQMQIPKNINFNLVPGLSIEIKEKLSYHSPSTIGLAQRISGITPASLIALMIYIKTKYVEN
jgi:tRNA uridine 5-carboxymethylaminomethyl modification enzyme